MLRTFNDIRSYRQLMQFNDSVRLSLTIFFVENKELLLPLTDYFEETWIGTPTKRNQRRSSVFNLQLWNQYDVTFTGLPKTNNNIEG